MGSEYPAWVNGTATESLSVKDRAIAYGDGVFETIRVSGGFLLDLHWQRLKLGLDTLSIPQDISTVKKQFYSYLSEYQAGLIKVIVTQGAGGRGYQTPSDPFPSIIIQGFDLPSYPGDYYTAGVSLYVCQTPVTVNPVFRGIKHLNRLEQVRARNEFDSVFAEGLMSNLKGELVEGTMSNLFYSYGGRLLTPSLDELAVGGTMRRYLMESCRDIVAIEEGSPRLDQLLLADEVFVCNSVFGIWPVRAIMTNTLNLSKLDTATSVTRLLQQKVMPQFS